MTLPCRVCLGEIKSELFSTIVLNRPVKFYDCTHCGYVQTENPTWLEEAYESAINDCDTGIMIRNQMNVGAVLATLLFLKKNNEKVVDCAAGYGILVRMLRDRGVDAWWSDPYCKNLLASGFEYKGEKGQLVTAFEAYEHFMFPVKETENFFGIAPNILLSTELISEPAPEPGKWWYYGFNHGQHIGFYRLKTLNYIAKKHNKFLISDGRRYHLFSDQPVNSFFWRTALKISFLVPNLFAVGRKSKVWEDFKYLGGTISSS
jgi:hypothetical protein